MTPTGRATAIDACLSGRALKRPGRPGEDIAITGAERPVVILSPALSLAA
jgi:hypothetical protein